MEKSPTLKFMTINRKSFFKSKINEGGGVIIADYFPDYRNGKGYMRISAENPDIYMMKSLLTWFKKMRTIRIKIPKEKLYKKPKSGVHYSKVEKNKKKYTRKVKHIKNDS